MLCSDLTIVGETDRWIHSSRVRIAKKSH